MLDRDPVELVTRSAAARSPRRDRPSTPAGSLAHLQRTAGNARVAALVQRPEAGEEESPVRDLMRAGGGRPLDPPLRRFMESRLGADLGDVRIHTGSRATEAARSVQAHAYTSGTDIVFQDGQYDPGTPAGQRMLAHELTHVLQQRSGPVDGTPAAGGLSVIDPSDRFERAAEASAERVVSGVQPLPVAPELQRHGAEEEPSPAGVVQRQEGEDLEEEEP